MDSIKDVVRSSVKVPDFDKHPMKAGGHIGRNVEEITITMKTIVRKPLMIKLELREFNFYGDNFNHNDANTDDTNPAVNNGGIVLVLRLL